jgi:hypothetical protein
MHPEIADKSPAEPAQLQDDQAIHCRQTYNVCLYTAGRHTINLGEVSFHHINTWAKFMPFSFVLNALYHYYLLFYLLFHKSETAFGCIFIAENLPIGTSSIGDQYKPRASGTQSSSPNKPSPMQLAAATGPSG